MEHQPRIGRPERPMPEDFPRYAQIEGRHKLEVRFNANGRTIDRWRKQLGVRYSRPVSDSPKRSIVTARKRIKAKIRMQNERIEDLEEFDAVGLVQRFGGAW